ncbi:MAG: hypothetical protein AAF750_05940 [Planctomycetota bacterium]
MKITTLVLVAGLLLLTLPTTLLKAEPATKPDQPPIPKQLLSLTPISSAVAKSILERENRTLENLSSSQTRMQQAMDGLRSDQIPARLAALEKAGEQILDQHTRNALMIKLSLARYESFRERTNNRDHLLPFELRLYQGSSVQANNERQITSIRAELSRLAKADPPPDQEHVQTIQEHLREFVREDGTPGPLAAFHWRVSMMDSLDEVMIEQQRQYEKTYRQLRENMYERRQLHERIMEEQLLSSELRATALSINQLKAIKPEATATAPATQPNEAQ